MYTVENVPPDISSLIVTKFRVVAHTAGPVAPGAVLSQNHWSIYLIHSNGSVRINMQLANPAGNNTRGILLISSHPYTSASTSEVR